MKTKFLDKVLKNHLPHCKMHEFSLQKDRRCSCGVEQARKELSEFKNLFEMAKTATEMNGRYFIIKSDERDRALHDLNDAVLRVW